MRIVRFLWGDLSPEDLKKFSLLSLGFFFIIGSWWPLKTLKDTLFLTMVGPQYQPTAKSVSVFLFFPLVLFYSFLVDFVSKEKLIYIFTFFYGILGLVFVYFMSDPQIGIPNTIAHPSRLFGWLFYVFSESYISLILAVYWSFVNDITTPESAQKGYGMLMFGNQFGGFLATLIGNYYSRDAALFTVRAPRMAFVSICMFFLVGIIVFLVTHLLPKENFQGYAATARRHPHEEQVSFFDGLRVLFTNPYIMGIFGVIFFQEIIGSVMTYQMQLLASSTYPSAGELNRFLFDFGLAVQMIAALFALFGTSFFQRRFGIALCLLAYPALLAALVVWYWYAPALEVIFCTLLVAKALNYALNQPAKEVLYIPTSRTIKYKSKAWIDMFGLRFAKWMGSEVNKVIGSSISGVGIFSLGIIGLWAFMSRLLGAAYDKAVKSKIYFE